MNGAKTVCPACHRPREPLLSARQLTVVGLAGQGLSNKEIGRALGISAQTVKNHFTAIFALAGAPDRTSAVVRALQAGLLRLEEL